jgi:hypothetical protein
VSEPQAQSDDARAAEQAPEQGLLERVRGRVATGTERARSASDEHVTLAVPFRAAERISRLAAGVLAGGVAYRLILWLLPVGLILGGVIGRGDADDIEDAVAEGGLPAAVVDAIGDVARAGDGNWWWLLAIGVPLLLWEGYTGAKALQLIHGLVWNDPPPRTNPLKGSLVFTGVCLVFVAAISLTWWFRLFFAYLVGRIVVTAPILNSSLHDELRRESREKHDEYRSPRTGPAGPVVRETPRPDPGPRLAWRLRPPDTSSSRPHDDVVQRPAHARSAHVDRLLLEVRWMFSCAACRHEAQ